MNKLMVLVIFSVALLHPAVNAGELDIPNSFTAGTPAVAADVNTNFTAVETAVDGNAVDIAALIASVATMETRLTALETDNEVLTSEIEDLQTDNVSLKANNDTLQNFITEVIPYLQGGPDGQGNQAVFFSGINLHINNGEGVTDSINATGNLVVGYDERFSANSEYCTVTDIDGNAYLEQAECENNTGTWSRNSQKIGSHNLVVGKGHNYTQFGGLIAGEQNTVVAPYSSISGGARNYAQAAASSVSGGLVNRANAKNSSVSGGFLNTASGERSAVSGGTSRSATEFNSWAAGSLSEDF